MTKKEKPPDDTEEVLIQDGIKRLGGPKKMLAKLEIESLKLSLSILKTALPPNLPELPIPKW